MKRVEVYLSLAGEDVRTGTLEFDVLRGKEVSQFEFAESFLKARPVAHLDPHLMMYRGRQFPRLESGFGMFQDAAPDSWGRRLIRRREKRLNLQESDYLLGVFDLTRTGALRFKLEGRDEFVNADGKNPVPPWTLLRTLEESARRFEADGNDEQALAALLMPGSSLGGARPKACVTAPDGSWWMAKFPSREDECDIGAWEYLAHVLAENAGLTVPPAQAKTFSGRGTTFLSRRFDRQGTERCHFASAMTMLGCEDRQETGNGTYLDIAEFLVRHGGSPDRDLPELWRRMAFSLMISNTDDHLRNHGFVWREDGWRLSPAYDLNPDSKRPGALSLELEQGVEIDSIEVLVEAAEYFRLTPDGCDRELRRVRDAVGSWREVAKRLGIARQEQELMAQCFRVL